MDPEIRHIIVRYLDGQASVSEKEKLLQWRRKSEEHERLFLQFRITRNLTRHSAKLQPDTEEAWEKLAARIAQRPGAFFFGLRRSYLFKIAAFITLLAVIGASVFFLKDRLFIGTPGSYTLVTSGQHKPEITLPDSTKVILNDGTTLRYAAGYNRKHREVFLSGQAYFEVKKGKPFTVHVPGGMKVRVLGTSFDVSAYQQDADVKVALVEGSVSIEAAGQQGGTEHIKIDPGTLITYNKSRKQLEVSELDVFTALRWKDKELAFDNESLDELAGALGNWYQVKIKVRGNTQKTNRYTLKIRNETLEETLSLLKTMIPMEYSIKEGQVEINIK